MPGGVRPHGKAVGGIVLFEHEHRAPALIPGYGGHLLYGSEKAEHHGIISCIGRIGADIAGPDVDVLNGPAGAVFPQNGESLLAAVCRSHTAHIGRQGQAQVAQAAPGIAYMVPGVQVRQHPLHQSAVVVAVFRSVTHKAHHFLIPLKHHFSPSVSGTRTLPPRVSAKAVSTR